MLPDKRDMLSRIPHTERAFKADHWFCSRNAYSGPMIHTHIEHKD